jgi:ribosomal protein S27AE
LIVFVNQTASSSSTYNIKVTTSGSTVDSSFALFGMVIVIVVVVLLVVVVILLRKKKTEPTYQYQFQQPIVQPSLCPKCGSAMRMIPQYHQWYCDQCRSYMLRPATVPQFQPPRY